MSKPVNALHIGQRRTRNGKLIWTAEARERQNESIRAMRKAGATLELVAASLGLPLGTVCARVRQIERIPKRIGPQARLAVLPAATSADADSRVGHIEAQPSNAEAKAAAAEELLLAEGFYSPVDARNRARAMYGLEPVRRLQEVPEASSRVRRLNTDHLAVSRPGEMA